MGMFFLTGMIVYIFSMYSFLNLKYRRYVKAVVKLNLKNRDSPFGFLLHLTCCSGSQMFQTSVAV